MCKIFVCVYVCVYIYVDGHLCCFHQLAIENKPSRNMGVQILVLDSAFIYFGCILRNAIV